MASKRTRQVAGATAGLAVGAASSAAIGYVTSKAVGVIASTKPVTSAAETVARVAPTLARNLPRIGTAAGLAVSAIALYQALKPVVANAQEARRQKKDQAAASTKPETMDEAEARLGQRFGGSPKDIRMAAENERKAMRRAPDQKTRDYHERRALQMERRYKEVTGEHIGPTIEGKAAPVTPAPTSPAAAPQGSLWQDVKGMFKPDPNNEFAQRRAQITKELDSVRTAVSNEIAGKNSSGQKGAGKNYDKLVGRQRELEGQLQQLAKEERDNNPFKVAFQTFAPIGAALGGYAIGSKYLSGVDKLKADAATTAKAVDTLGRRAEKILKSRPNSIIAGTPSGDKAKALVNEAYARGGAQPAFSSPGYPAAKGTAQQVFSGAGRAKPTDYIPPAFNAASAAIAGTISVYDPNENRRAGERVLAGFEAGLAIGQWKALAGAQAIRPAAAAISSIEALRNRVVREAATGAPAGVALAKGAGKLATAKGAAQISGIRAGAKVSVEGVRASGRVGAATLRSKKGQIAAGAEVGIAKARGAASVQRAAPPAPAASRDRRASSSTYERTYTKGPKAGHTEIVRKG